MHKFLLDVGLFTWEYFFNFLPKIVGFLVYVGLLYTGKHGKSCLTKVRAAFDSISLHKKIFICGTKGGLFYCSIPLKQAVGCLAPLSTFLGLIVLVKQ